MADSRTPRNVVGLTIGIGANAARKLKIVVRLVTCRGRTLPSARTVMFVDDPPVVCGLHAPAIGFAMGEGFIKKDWAASDAVWEPLSWDQFKDERPYRRTQP